MPADGFSGAGWQGHPTGEQVEGGDEVRSIGVERLGIACMFTLLRDVSMASGGNRRQEPMCPLTGRLVSCTEPFFLLERLS